MRPRTARRRWMVLTASVLLAGTAAACGSEAVDTAPADSAAITVPATEAPPDTDTEPDEPATPDGPRVVSAEEGAAARSRVPRPASGSDAAAELAVADSSMMLDCGVYEPTPEEVATANADTAGLIAAFDRYGIASTSTTDANGFVVVEYDYLDVVAGAVAASYFDQLYPVEPIPQEELDAIVAQNDVVAAELDRAGVAYTRTTDAFGYESLEYDYDDPAASAAVDAAWLIISPPQPPTPEELVSITAENDKLAAGFDAAGIPYERVADELGWEWIEWDFEDPALTDRVNAVFDELYPPIAIDPIEGGVDCPVVDPVAVEEPAVEEPAVEEPVAIEPALEESPEQLAVADAETDAMIAGFTDVGVEFRVDGESPYRTVVFDIADDAAVPVIASVIASR